MWVLILQKEKGGACSGNAIVEEELNTSSWFREIPS